MLNLDVTTKQHKGMNVHIVPTTKFKTITITLKLKTPINRDIATQRALLSYVLDKATNKYPTAKQVRMKLDDLYGAVFGIANGKKGPYHTLSFRMEIANEKFLTKQVSLLKDALNLLSEILYNPYIEEGAFKPAIVTREKRTLRSNLKGIIDNKVAYANMRLTDEMCKGEAHAIHTHGYEEDLEKITPAHLYDYYKDMLTNDIFDLYIVGDVKVDEVMDIVKETFTRQHSREEAPIDIAHKEIEEVKEVTERQQINQAKLHIGYRTNVTIFDQDFTALQVFNGLFGAFPNSKLFKNVREKHSLAYYTASRLGAYNGIMIVFSGIAPDDNEKAQAIIDEQVEAMKQGDFTDEEIAEMKTLLLSNMKEALDSASAITEMLYNRHAANLEFNLNKSVERLEKVSRDEIITVAHKIEKDTIYVLTEEEVK